MYVLPYGQMSLWGINNNTFNFNTLIALPIISKSFNKNNLIDSKFMALFIGIIDGDGYIEIGPQKQYQKVTKAIVNSTIRARLVLRLENRDRMMLMYIRDVLQVGSISYLDSRNQTRLIFSLKDLSIVIIPLIKQYNLTFLTRNRLAQYALLCHIIDNKIIHWNDIIKEPFGDLLTSKESDSIYNRFKKENSKLSLSCNQILNLDFFNDWIVGFTIAEGSFFLKANGSYFYQIKQKGLNNSEILKAICLTITGREAYPMKADKADAYQLSLSSINDIQKVINFFSDTNNHSLLGYKLKQYEEWLTNLKGSKRYGNIKY